MLILVNENDNQIGIWEKMDIHRKAQLHRAFSILVYNDKKELLIQKRADCKYHSAWKWANTCCSHPEDGETLDHAIHRRIIEELWFDTEFSKKIEFIYKAKLDHELTEYEYLHVYEWRYNWEVIPNPEEVSDYKWMSISDIQVDMQQNQNAYSKRFLIMFELYFDKLFK